MTMKKETILKSNTSCLKPEIYEAKLRSARIQRERFLAKKVETFVSELKADGVRYFIFTDINANCHIKVDCTNEQFGDMLTELASRVQEPFATFLGLQFISHGLALLKIHDKQALDRIKQGIAEL